MKQNIIFLDATQEYPVKFSAANTKVNLMGRGLKELGNRVLIINSIIGSTASSGYSRENLEYISFPQRISKYCAWFFNLLPLLNLLIKHRQRNSINVIVLGTSSYFLFFLIYVFMGRLAGYRLTAMYDEWHITGMEQRLSKRINAILFDYTFGYLLDCIIPISLFLEQKAARFVKKQLRLPILAEYTNCPEQLDLKANNGYFLYCAQAGYLYIIIVLLDAFARYLQYGRNEKLILVLSGKTEEINMVKNEIEIRGLSDRTEIRTQVPFDELNQLYQQALALMIPLDPNSIKDQARFSQKIAEYLSAARPIITSNVGEIPHYFTNEVDAIITAAHSPEHYSKAMLQIATNPEEATAIGHRGWVLGQQKFNYKMHCLNLCTFFEDL